MTSTLTELHYQLEEVFSSHLNPLLDLLCELFLSPEELLRNADRGRRLRVLSVRLHEYADYGATPMALERLLLSCLQFAQAQAQLVRNSAPNGRKNPLKPKALDRLFELGLALLALQEQELSPERRSHFARAAELSYQIYQGCYDVLSESSFSGLPAREVFPMPLSLPGDLPLSTQTFRRASPKMRSTLIEPPQGKSLQFYKDSGYSKFMRSVEIVFETGIHANRPCYIVNYNGSNTLCFFPDTSTSHYISCRVPLSWSPRKR